MICLIVFFAIIALWIVAAIRFIPVEYRRRYVQGPKDREYWLASASWNAIWIVAAIQYCSAHSSRAPLALRVSGAAMMMGGYALVIWARRHNPFFVPAIVRPDYIVITGPYSRLCHPGYDGLGIAALGSFFLLGQWWTAAPLAAYLILLQRRVYIEDRFLSAHFLR